MRSTIDPQGSKRARLAGLQARPHIGSRTSPRSGSSLDLIVATDRGLYCAAGDFHIDPWRPVPRAVITHAHSDHARFGSDVYVCHRDTAPILRKRLGDVTIETAGYGEVLSRNGVQISFHPAGHVLGSAQIRVAMNGETWVASGDYKLESDGVSPAFEPLRCHVFITEFDLWPADLSLAPAGRDFRRHRPLAAREHRRRARERPFRLRARQSPAAHRACRPGARPDRLPWRYRRDQHALSRGRRRSAAHPSRDGNRR